jgi:hypothetical protein
MAMTAAAMAFLIKPAFIFITLNRVEPDVWRGIRARFYLQSTVLSRLGKEGGGYLLQVL